MTCLEDCRNALICRGDARTGPKHPRIRSHARFKASSKASSYRGGMQYTIVLFPAYKRQLQRA
jgi:hypothetical protein